MWIRDLFDRGSGIFSTVDPGSFRPWIRDGKIWIRDKHPGFATLERKKLVLYSCTYRRNLSVQKLLLLKAGL